MDLIWSKYRQDHQTCTPRIQKNYRGQNLPPKHYQSSGFCNFWGVTGVYRFIDQYDQYDFNFVTSDKNPVDR